MRRASEPKASRPPAPADSRPQPSAAVRAAERLAFSSGEGACLECLPGALGNRRHDAACTLGGMRIEPNGKSTVVRAVTTALIRTLAAMAVAVSGGHVVGAQAPAVVRVDTGELQGV